MYWELEVNCDLLSIEAAGVQNHFRCFCFCCFNRYRGGWIEV